MCRVESKTVSPIVNECKMLAQKEFEKGQGSVCRYIHWRLCKKHSSEGAL